MGGPLAILSDLPPRDSGQASPFRTLAYLDATLESPTWHSTEDAALHVLWTAPGIRPILAAGDTDGGCTEYPVAPGDFLLVPAGRSFAIGAGIVAVMVGSGVHTGATKDPLSSAPTLPPTHGLPVFSGFNRQTFGVATPTLAMCRWKLTHSQVIVAPPGQPLWLSNLVEPVAVSWTGGMELLGRTEGCFVAPGSRVTVSPNNLGYVLVAWVPNLAREVIAPLRSAGYTNADIASLGVPESSLVPDQARG